MSPLETRMRALLRWYPRSWRARHGEVMLATLLDDAEARGLDAPTRADAWSLRVHGLSARATPMAAAFVAGAGLVVTALWVVARQIEDALTLSPTRQVLVDTTWLDPLWTGLAALQPLLAGLAIVLLAASRRGSAAAALLAVGAVVAAFVVLGAASVWSVLHPEVVPTPGGGSVTVFGAPSIGARIAAAAILAAGVVPLVHAWLLRAGRAAWPLAVVVALVIGAATVTDVGSTLLLALAVVVVILGMRETATRRADDAWSWSPVVVAALTGTALVLAVPTAALLVAEGVGALRVHAGGARVVTAVLLVSGIPLALALALVLRRRLGRVVWPVAGLVVLATLAGIGAALLVPGRPVAEVLDTLVAVLAGLALAVLLAATIAARTPARVIAAVAVGASSVALGGVVAPLLALAAWLVALPLLVVSVVRLRRAPHVAVARSTAVHS